MGEDKEANSPNISAFKNSFGGATGLKKCK